MKNNNNLSDKEFDDLFRQSAEQINPNVWPDAWSKMEEKLDAKDKKRRIFIFWRWAAAVLIISGVATFSTFIVKKESNLASEKRKLNDDSSIKKTKNSQNKENSALEISKSKEKFNSKEIDQIGSEKFAKNEQDNLITNKKKENKKISTLEKSTKNELLSKQKVVNYQEKEKINNPNIEKIIEENSGKVAIINSKSELPVKKKELNKDKIESIESEITTKTNNPDKASNASEIDTVIVAKSDSKVIATDQNSALIQNLPASIKKNKSLIRNLSFNIGLSPDYSMVTNSDLGGMGNNFQFLLAYNFTEKLQVKAGIMRSMKYYDAKPEDYEWPIKWGVPSSPLTGISAACRMIDIPIILSYQLFSKNRNSVYSSLGVTSYKMLNERYDYHYENDADPKIKWRKWEGNTGMYGWGVVNFAFGYQRRIYKKLNIQFEPFVKMPIKNVGFGKVKLLSTGMFVNLNVPFSRN